MMDTTNFVDTAAVLCEWGWWDMNYSEIKYFDIANGEGVRTSLFVSGCRHGCPGCFNPEQWDFTAGKPFSLNILCGISLMVMVETVLMITIRSTIFFSSRTFPGQLYASKVR